MWTKFIVFDFILRRCCKPCFKAACTVIGFIFEVTKGERPCGKTILVGSCVARDHAAHEVGILLDVDIKAFAPGKESCLIACTAVVGVDISFVPRSAECGLGEGTKRFYLRIPVGVRCFLFCLVDVPRDTKAGGVVVFLVGFFLLQGINIEIPANLCRDLLALCLAPDDVHILVRGEAEVVLCGNESRGVGGNRFFAIPIGFVCTDADICQSRRGKGCTDACRAEFVLGGGDACIFPCLKAHVSLCRKGYVISYNGRAFDCKVTFSCGDVCISTCSNTASRIFGCYILHAAVGFARPEADVEGEGLTFERILSLAEFLTDETSCL